jgi:hypothetical protein
MAGLEAIAPPIAKIPAPARTRVDINRFISAPELLVWASDRQIRYLAHFIRPISLPSRGSYFLFVTSATYVVVTVAAKSGEGSSRRLG